MIQLVFLSCSYFGILLLSKFPCTNSKVQHSLGACTTTSPSYAHISSFDQIGSLSSNNNDMTQLHCWSPDLHEGTLDNLSPTSLHVKTKLVKVYHIYERQNRSINNSLSTYESCHQQPNYCENSLGTSSHLQIC